jgi:hypothetical protein
MYRKEQSSGWTCLVIQERAKKGDQGGWKPLVGTKRNKHGENN